MERGKPILMSYENLMRCAAKFLHARNCGLGEY
jgi:hypothetical protein